MLEKIFNLLFFSQFRIKRIKNKKMKVLEKIIDNTNVTVTFKDARALMNYILAPKPDILGAILRQEVVFEGNLNYLYKFAYMSRRLQLMATGNI